MTYVPAVGDKYLTLVSNRRFAYSPSAGLPGSRAGDCATQLGSLARYRDTCGKLRTREVAYVFRGD
jgi:hypothetical protein